MTPSSTGPHNPVNQAEIGAGLAATPGYRYAELVGDQLFVAGQVPLDKAGIIASRSPSGQASACLENLETLIGVHAFTRHDVRHLTVYVAGPRDQLVQAWEAVTEWWGGSVPPATLLGVSALGYEDQLVEIDATVVRSHLNKEGAGG